MLLRSLLLSCLCALAFAAPATAQDPQVDPGSPAGTEYQLPIERARAQAAPRAASKDSSGSPASPGASGEAPLFGAGVEAKKPTSGGAKKPGTDSDPATTAGVEPDPAPSTPATVRAQAPAPDDGGSALVAIGAGAGGVLLLGGLAGLAWRRQSADR